MRKILPIALSAVMLTGLLTGCGTNYNADENTLFILKNGKVVSTDIDEFDTETYSEDDFKEYVNNVIATYNASYGEGSVKLKKLKVKDEKATVILQYASAADYMAFNSIHLFAGSISEAEDNGFRFEGDFASVGSEDIELCGADEFMDQTDCQVVILDTTGLNVNTPGKILYASIDSVELVDEKTIRVSENGNLLNSASGTESMTEEATEAVITDATEAVEATESADDGSVSDDDLLNSVEEATDSDTYFDDEEENGSGSSYIYIIYK